MTARFEQDPRQKLNSDLQGVIKDHTNVSNAFVALQSIPRHVKNYESALERDRLGRYCLPANIDFTPTGLDISGACGTFHVANTNREFNNEGIVVTLPVTYFNGKSSLVLGHTSGRIFPHPKRHVW